MKIFKLYQWKNIEFVIFMTIIIGIILNSIFLHDSIVATISAICGITYTALAGKGLPVCYLFGITGSFFYGLLSFQNEIWGNLLLYMFYYIPMQITGYFAWKKNLKKDSSEIVKKQFDKKTNCIIFCISVVLITITMCLLKYFNDPHPLLDSITTIVSIVGMYCTVKRVLEQWIAWIVVNLLSLIMWIKILITGQKVCSTVIMWSVYSLLAIYFYIVWHKELALQNNNVTQDTKKSCR